MSTPTEDTAELVRRAELWARSSRWPPRPHLTDCLLGTMFRRFVREQSPPEET